MYRKTVFLLATFLPNGIKHYLLIRAVIYWLIRNVFSSSYTSGPSTGAEGGQT